MAVNKAFNVVHPIVEIPSELSTFKRKPQVRQTGQYWEYKSSVTVNYGTTAGTWTSTTPYTKIHNRDLYSSSQEDGLRIIAMGYGNSNQALYMLNDVSRWMPASVLYGVGFETYHKISSTNSNHQLYLGAYGVVFQHRTGSGQRIYAWDTGRVDGPGSSVYNYDRIRSLDADVSTIRSWGKDWLFQGLLVSIKNKGSGVGTTDSQIDIYNVRVGHKYSLNSDLYRVHPLALRPYTARDMHPTSSSKFAYFHESLW